MLYKVWIINPAQPVAHSFCPVNDPSPLFSRWHIQFYFLFENCCILIKIPMKFVPGGSVKDLPALVQITAWIQMGTKPLSYP